VAHAVSHDLVQQQHRQAEYEDQPYQLNRLRRRPEPPLVRRLPAQQGDQSHRADHGEQPRPEVVGVEPADVLTGEAMEQDRDGQSTHPVTLGEPVRGGGVPPLNAA